jgi:hypothetical protein
LNFSCYDFTVEKFMVVVRVPFVGLLGTIFRSSDGHTRAKYRIRAKPAVLWIPEPVNPWAKFWTKPATRKSKICGYALRSKPDLLPSLTGLLYIYWKVTKNESWNFQRTKAQRNCSLLFFNHITSWLSIKNVVIL